MDLSHITTPAEAEALMQAVAELYQRLQQTAADTDTARRARIGAAVQSLTDLIGPDQPSAAGLILEGMEILTATARDVALVVGEEV